MNSNRRAILSLVSLFLFLCCHGQPKPGMRIEDRVRIREAVRIAALDGEKIWRGMSSAPLAVLLVTDSAEFLVNHPNPSEDFTLLGKDPMLQSRVYYRKTVFDKHFLATFPAINGLNTIVVGTPENTGLNSTGWVITVLHEHFHQFVYSRPGYYDAVGLLNLSGGDKTGMWMLNYPFPYADTGVDRAYGTYAETLARAVASIGTPSFATDLHSYLAARDVFESSLDSAAYRYFSFQIWQEGIARYTEYKFLQLLDSYKPSREFERLPDYVPFGKYRETFYRDQLKRITDWDLSVHQRECFYGIGFGEGLILDALNPRWRERYLTDKFYIEHYAVDVLKKQ